jgi:hypothetical protein
MFLGRAMPLVTWEIVMTKMLMVCVWMVWQVHSEHLRDFWRGSI